METLNSLLLRLRQEAGWSLTQASEATGFSRTHIRDVERGRKRPSAKYLRRLSEVYNSPDLLDYSGNLTAVKGKKVYGRLGAAVRAAFKPSRPPLLLPRVEVAYKSALCYPSGRSLLQQIVTRPGQHPNRWIGMKLLARELNGLEQLSVLGLLAYGAEIESITPQRAGFRRPVVAQVDVPWLALVVPHGEALIIFFPQLGIEVRRGLVRYADYLVGVAVEGQVCFINVELDGPGHVRERDCRRQEELNLPTLRYKDWEVERPDFTRRLLDDIVAVWSTRYKAPRLKSA